MRAITNCLVIALLLTGFAPFFHVGRDSLPAEKRPHPPAPLLQNRQSPILEKGARDGSDQFIDVLSPFTVYRSLFTDSRSPFTASPIVFYCSYVPDHAALINQVTEQTWGGWISKLSGAEEWTVGDKTATIITRSSFALFDEITPSPAFDYLHETLLTMYTADRIEIDPYTYSGLHWENLIVEIPGTRVPEEVVILSAHFDSAPSSGSAPGADDNASGSAALLEAARILQVQSFPRTIRLVWFTGEEQGLRGSAAYTADHDLSSVVGVINLDMYAYDGDNDRCFELHVGTRAESQPVGRCLVDAIDAYDLSLNYDYLTQGATTRSDHYNFWLRNIGAVEILENYTYPIGPGGCSITDENNDSTPYYHSMRDTFDTINLTTGLAITKVALAAALSMADPAPMPYSTYIPWFDN